MNRFSAGEDAWTARLGNLRDVVRPELVGRQLAENVPAGATVLDVGCGQGTQALRLARAGCVVTGVDPSRSLLGLLSAAAQAPDVPVEVVLGGIEDLDGVLSGRQLGLVSAHGLLMYVDDRREGLAARDPYRGLASQAHLVAARR